MKEQIYSITCDNAANMVKLVKLISDENKDEIIIPNENVNTSDDENDVEYENDGPPLCDDDIQNELNNGM